MGIRLEEKIVKTEAHGDVKFLVPQLNGMESTLLFLKLGNRLAPAIAKSAEALKAKDKAKIFASVVEHIEPELFEHTANQLLRGCSAVYGGNVDNSAGQHLGEIFHGDPFGLIELVIFALGVNYGNFFERLTRLQSSLEAKKDQP